MEKGIAFLDSEKKKKVESTVEEVDDELTPAMFMKDAKAWASFKTQFLIRFSLESPTRIQLKWLGICCMENTMPVIRYVRRNFKISYLNLNIL